jgi:hypothetical protein
MPIGISLRRVAVLAATLLGIGALQASAEDAMPPGTGPASSDASWQGGPWEAFQSSTGKSAFSSGDHRVVVERATGDNVSLVRTTDLSPVPATMICTFDFAVRATGSKSPMAQTFRIGTGFTAGDGDETNGRTFARLGVGMLGSASYLLRDLESGRISATLEGTQAITWALNHSGSALEYPAPDGTTESIGNARMDVWVGRIKVFDDAAATNANVAMTDLKWFWNAGTGTTSIQRLSLRTFDGTPIASGTPSAVIALPVTSASPEPVAEAPRVDLYRPTPNPFEGTTRFDYAVPAGASRISIGVYDVAGRRVRGLMEGLQSPGRYRASWDGLGDDGARARDGVYFLRAAIGTDVRMLRVVYLQK